MVRALDIWLVPYLRRDKALARAPCTDLIVAVCDHFEPLHGADREIALGRVSSWRERLGHFQNLYRDSDGVGPRQTFFCPIEQYDEAVQQSLAEMCGETGSEVEIHLHHENDTEEGLREALERGKEDFRRHGLLCRDQGGATRFGFIHGNWALHNSHPEGRHCGVANELAVLRASGCYADFTMPSAPDRTQTRTINSIYYAGCTPEPGAHDGGIPVSAAPEGTADLREREDHLLLVQGPLGLNWRRRKWGLAPRIENGDLTMANPPTRDRLCLWLRLGIGVARRPEWRFVKLHTHGALPRNSAMLQGPTMEIFHDVLAEFASADRTGFRLHYVSAREMVNMIHAAEDGEGGDAGKFRDYRYRLG